MVLYKKDSKGKIRCRECYADGINVITVAGIVGGKQVTNSYIAKQKNIGRSNETTQEEQAQLEVESKIKKKLDEGYFKTKEEAESEEIILPMLAQSYDKHSKKIDRDEYVIVQPKLDGMRAMIIVKGIEVKMISRGGKEITTMDHILTDEFYNMSDSDEVLIFDGELYAHGLSFQENMKLIKKYREGESEKVKFHIYDYVSDEFYLERIGWGSMLTQGCKHVEQVPYDIVNNETQLKEYHARYIADGYEGTMIRHGNTGYEMDKRSYSLLKYKDFIDEVYEIIDVVPMDKRPDQGKVVCKIGDQTFEASPKMSHEERNNLLINKSEVIGKKAEIRFFEFTDDGIPRFPVFLGVRLDK